MTTAEEQRGTAHRYGDALADVYDLMYPWSEGPLVAAWLASLVPPGSSALELGVGTGRIAVPAARAGLRVHGIDASPRMLERLARHDPEGRVTTTLGDFTTRLTDAGPFDLVYAVCNTLFMVEGQEAQTEVLARAREQLRPDGLLVLEVYDPAPFHALERPLMQARHLAPDTLMIDTVSADPVTQTVVEIHTVVRPGTVETFVEASHYCWPRELDAMARLAGLELVRRVGGWSDEPYTAGSPRHVSVYRPASGRG